MPGSIVTVGNACAADVKGNSTSGNGLLARHRLQKMFYQTCTKYLVQQSHLADT